MCMPDSNEIKFCLEILNIMCCRIKTVKYVTHKHVKIYQNDLLITFFIKICIDGILQDQ